MSKIYEAIKDAQDSVRRDGDTNNLIRSGPEEERFLRCRSIDGSISVHLVENGLPVPKQSSAAGVLLGKLDEEPACTLIVEGHARIPGAQRNNLFGDLFHLNTFVERWNINPGRCLEIMGLYRFVDQGQANLTRQDLVALNAIGPQAPLLLLLVELMQSDCNLHLFVVRHGTIVASWTLLSTEERSLLKADHKSFSALDKPKMYLPPASSEIRGVEKQPARRTWLYSTGIATLAALVILGLFGVRATRGLSPSVNSANMGLRLAREGNDWRLSWDANSPIVRDAAIGRLFIVDGNIEKRLELDNADLTGGAILYSAATNNLLFRLQIDTSYSPKPVIQSVRAVDNLVSAPNSGSAIFTAEPEITVRPTSSPTTSVSPPGPLLAKTSTISFSRPSELKIRASTLSGPPIAPPELPMSVLQDSPPPNPLGTVLLAAAFGPPSSPTQGREAPFEPAQLTVRREPIYPEGANGIEGAVKLQFLITNTGMVRDVKLVSGNPILGAAAKAAVGMWRYKPASQSGSPIQTEGVAVITFNRLGTETGAGK